MSLWCWIKIPVVPLSDITNNVDVWIMALVDKWNWKCCLYVKKPGWASTWYANFWDVSTSVNIYTDNWILEWTRIVNQWWYDLSFTDWDVFFASWITNESWVFLNSISDNTWKRNCEFAFPLWLSKSNNEIVPMDIVTERDMPLYIKGINVDISWTPTLTAWDYDVFQVFPWQDTFNVPSWCLAPWNKWIVDVDCQYFAFNVTWGAWFEFKDWSNRWEEIIMSNQIRVNWSPTRMNWGDSQDTSILSSHWLLTSNNVVTYRDRFNVNEWSNTIEVRPTVNLKQSWILTGNPNIRIVTVMSYTIKIIKS